MADDAKPNAPPRKRLSRPDLDGDLSASLIAQALRETFERLESFETGAAKASDVREVADQFKAYREQLDERNALRDKVDNAILNRLDAMQTAAGKAAANTKLARFWAKVVAMGTVASPTLVLAFAYWGVAHPTAFGGLAGSIGLAILAIAKATTSSPPVGGQPDASIPPPQNPT